MRWRWKFTTSEHKKMLREVIDIVWRPEFRWFRPIVEGTSNGADSCFEFGLQITARPGTATIRAYYDCLSKVIRNRNIKVLINCPKFLEPMWRFSNKNLKKSASLSYFIIKPNRCTNFMNLFWHKTLHVSGSSSAHHQEFIHCTLSSGICHTGL